MEVKPGYKQTEMGVIPEDWAIKTLGNIASIATGNTPPTRDPANYGDEFLFVSPMDMGSHKHIFRTERRLSQKGFEISRPFPTGSVLFVCIGSTIGKCGIATETLTSNQQINAILPSEGTSSDYLYYAVSAVAPKIQSLAGEQAVPIVNKTAFSETVIPLPPTKIEQEAIADALSDADALIESLEQLIAKKCHLKQGTMQELLTGKKRLPGFEVKPGYKQTEIGVIPEDWDLFKLAQICGFITKGATPTTYGFSWEQSGILFLRSECVSEKGLDLSQSMFISSEAHTTLRRSAVADGDILITITGNVGRVILLNGVGEANLNQHIARVRVTAEHAHVGYVFHILSQPITRARFLSITTGQAYPQISLRQVREAKIPLPPIKAEQEAIAETLTNMDTEIAALKAKLTKMRHIKQGMMQELLTGRIRLI